MTGELARCVDEIEVVITAQKKNSNGFLNIASAIIAKEQVLKYKMWELPPHIRKELDGDYDDAVYVYQSLDALAEFMDDYEGLPITDGHTWNPVTVKDITPVAGLMFNAKKTKKGIKAAATVTNSDCIFDIEDGTKTMLSLGQMAKFVVKAGTYDGQDYTVVKEIIKPNHVALTKSGRCGPECAVADSAINDCACTGHAPDKPKEEKKSMDMETVAIGDEVVSVEKGGKQHIKDLLKENKRLQKAHDALEGERDTLKADLQTANDENTDEKLQEKIRVGAAVRASIVTKAAAFIGDEATGTKTNKELMVATLEKAGRTGVADKAEDYLIGAFDSLEAPKSGSENGKTFAPANDATGGDAPKEKTVAEVRDAFIAKNKKG